MTLRSLALRALLLLAPAALVCYGLCYVLQTLRAVTGS